MKNSFRNFSEKTVCIALSLTAMTLTTDVYAGFSEGNQKAGLAAVYTVKDSFAYPEAFYGKQFLDDNGRIKAMLYLADYPKNLTNHHKIAATLVPKVFGCTGIEVAPPPQDDDFIDDHASFKNCRISDDLNYNGDIYVSGGFYQIIVHTPDFPENFISEIMEYDESFQLSLAAQDYPSAEAPSATPDSLSVPQGYVILPTFRYPDFHEMPDIARTFINPETRQLFSYVILRKSSPGDRVPAEEIQDFCQNTIPLEKAGNSAGLYTFRDCTSPQYSVPVITDGSILQQPDGSLIFEIHSRNITDAELETFMKNLK